MHVAYMFLALDKMIVNQHRYKDELLLCFCFLFPTKGLKGQVVYQAMINFRERVLKLCLLQLIIQVFFNLLKFISFIDTL